MMTFYLINSSNASSSQVDTLTDPPYSMHDIISNPLERLRELFSVTKHLLLNEGDSSIRKVMKALFTPITAVAMGGLLP